MQLDRTGDPRVMMWTESFSKMETSGAAGDNVGEGVSESGPATPRESRI